MKKKIHKLHSVHCESIKKFSDREKHITLDFFLCRAGKKEYLKAKKNDVINFFLNYDRTMQLA